MAGEDENENEKKDKRPNPADALPDLPELDESTDLLELNVDLDPGAPEPVGEIPVDDVDLLTAASDDWIELSTHEPEPTELLPESIERGPPIQLVEDDLEDFATQEELPILPWQLEVDLLEIGQRLRAVLDPTIAQSRWEQIAPTETSLQVTLRMRMLDVPVDLAIVKADEELLRIGRDVLSGRVLIIPD